MQERNFDVNKYTDDFIALYKVALDLVDSICCELENTGNTYFKTDELTAEQYDILVRTSLYILRIEIFNGAKYNKTQLDFLTKICECMEYTHEFYLLNIYETQTVHNMEINRVKEMYEEAMAKFDERFMRGELTLERFIISPLYFCGYTIIFNKFTTFPEAELQVVLEEHKKSKEFEMLQDFYLQASIGTVKFIGNSKNRISTVIENILKK